MKLFSHVRWAGAVALAVGCGVGSAGAPARADSSGYSLTLSGPTKAPVGKAFVLTATSHGPPGSPNVVTLDVDAYDYDVVQWCPGGAEEAYQLVARTHGGVMAHSVALTHDASGKATAVVGGTAEPPPGKVLICGYSHDSVNNTFATATFHFAVTGAAKSGSKKKKGA